MPDLPVGTSVDVDVDGEVTGPEQGRPATQASDPGSAGAATAAPAPTGAPAPAPPGTRALSILTTLMGSKAVRWGFVVITVGLGIWAIVSDWARVHKALVLIGFGTPAIGLIAVLAGLLTLMQIYRVLLAALGSPLRSGVVAQILFIGQLGKYLPGSVWPVLAQMELGAQHQVPRRRSASASVLNMVLALGTGILVGLVTLPFTAHGEPYWWVFLFAPLILVCLYPKVLNWILDRLLRLAKRPALEQPLTGRAILTALGWGVLGWIFYGLQIWVMADQLGGLSGASGVLLAIGGFAFAWCAGFVVVLAPAGAGIREIVLVSLLGPKITYPGALAVALVSRVLMTLGDFICAGAAAWVARRSGQLGSPGRHSR